jgi:hypothetical protein
LSLFLSLFPVCSRSSLLTEEGGGGGGAKSHDDEKALSSINHSIPYSWGLGWGEYEI